MTQRIYVDRSRYESAQRYVSGGPYSVSSDVTVAAQDTEARRILIQLQPCVEPRTSDSRAMTMPCSSSDVIYRKDHLISDSAIGTFVSPIGIKRGILDLFSESARKLASVGSLLSGMIIAKKLSSKLGIGSVPLTLASVPLYPIPSIAGDRRGSMSLRIGSLPCGYTSLVTILANVAVFLDSPVIEQIEFA